MSLLNSCVSREVLNTVFTKRDYTLTIVQTFKHGSIHLLFVTLTSQQTSPNREGQKKTTCGESRIRTHGPVTVFGFQDRRDRPTLPSLQIITSNRHSTSRPHNNVVRNCILLSPTLAVRVPKDMICGKYGNRTRHIAVTRQHYTD